VVCSKDARLDTSNCEQLSEFLLYTRAVEIQKLIPGYGKFLNSIVTNAFVADDSY
jgi:hypothetical protein